MAEAMINNREFYVVIEKDEDGYYVGEVAQLKACYSQGETIDELMENIKEVIQMCLEELEEANNSISINEFVGVQKVKL
jgi:predicted RNase H-like HicB family nuclease